MTLFVAFFLPLVIALGVWQLNRASEKRALEEAFLANITALPVRSETLSDTALQRPFARLRVTGQLASEVFLVDNQVHTGRQGYWVVQVLREASGRGLLVNRGFVAAPQLRSELPSVATSVEPVELVGFVWPYTGLVPLLREEVWFAEWPKRVQRLNIAAMAQLVDAVPVEIRLEANAEWANEPAPLAGVLKDDVHLGYAATWFGLGGALLVLFVVYGRKRARERAAGGSTKNST